MKGVEMTARLLEDLARHRQGDRACRHCTCRHAALALADTELDGTARDAARTHAGHAARVDTVPADAR
jgi:hypothetical protein